MLPCWSVPKSLDERGLAKIDILHCDTQGAELGVLEGSLPLFRDGRINWVFVSTHAFQISGDPLTHQRCLNLLQQTGAGWANYDKFCMQDGQSLAMRWRQA